MMNKAPGPFPSQNQLYAVLAVGAALWVRDGAKAVGTRAIGIGAVGFRVLRKCGQFVRPLK